MLKEKLYRFNDWNQKDIEKIISYIDTTNLTHLDIESSIAKVANFNIDFITKEMQGNWLELGIRFIDVNNFLLDDFLLLFHKASVLLSTSETLSITVNNFIKSLVPIHADEGFDVSFSDPYLPYTVFVSIPHPWEKNGVERFLEGLIHESLHLQLTAIENIYPIVYETELTNNLYSPWKGEGRDARGLLHAVYVFSHLYHFWSNVHLLNLDSKNFAFNRCNEIKNQILKVQHLPQLKVLTPFGIKLAESHLNSKLYA